MPYVQRDQSNKIIGRYANPQPGYAEEWVESITPTEQELAIATIAALEEQQVRRITARADREFRMALFVTAGLTAHPAFIALKAIDDAIKAERVKL